MEHTLRNLFLILSLAIFWALLLAACSSSAANNANMAGDGEALFKKSVMGSVAGCATCHSTEPGTIIVGPSLAGIGSAAAQRVEGLSAENYLRQSITQPDAYVVEGFPKSIMPSKYAAELSEAEINDLTAYLLSLK